MIMISLSSNPAVCQQKGLQSDLSFAFFACCRFEPFGTLPLFIYRLLLPASKCLFPPDNIRPEIPEQPPAGTACHQYPSKRQN